MSSNIPLYTVTALDDNGDVVYTNITTESWWRSELTLYVDEAMSLEPAHILIEKTYK